MQGRASSGASCWHTGRLTGFNAEFTEIVRLVASVDTLEGVLHEMKAVCSMPA
jgi:hypothetical protein